MTKANNVEVIVERMMTYLRGWGGLGGGEEADGRWRGMGRVFVWNGSVE